MKNKKIVIGAVVLVVAFLLFMVVSGGKAKKSGAAGKTAIKAGAKAQKGPSKKSIPNGMAGLTVKLQNFKKADILTGGDLFKSIDERRGVYSAHFITNNMQVVEPGTYDVVLQTSPRIIYKGIRVAGGRENIENIGCITGVLSVKMLNSAKKDAAYPIKVLQPKTGLTVANSMTNRNIELIYGTYDVEIGSLPREHKKGVKIEAGKETAIDMGFKMGSFTLNAYDENKKEARCSAKIINPANGEVVATIMSNRPADILEGVYNIEIYTMPRQVKKDVKISAGEETKVEVVVQNPLPAAVKVKK